MLTPAIPFTHFVDTGLSFLAWAEAVRENRPRSFIEFTPNEAGAARLSYRACWSYTDECVVSLYGGAR